MSTATNTQAVPDDLDVMHADQITRIWRECQAQGLDHVAFAWRIEREGWRRLLTALTSAPPAPSMGGWMPIESAPKDGTRVILAWGGKSINGFYLDNSNTDRPWAGWRVESMVPAPAGQPSAWQPFPQPPKEKP